MNNIDVLIPMYNAEKTIEECIRSVINQTIKVNIIVCDDCSKDGSLNIINNIQCDNITVIKNDVNLGYLKTFNKLLEYSKADYISFLDSDDILCKDKIKKQFDFLNTNRDIDVVGCNFKRIDNDNRNKSSSSALPLNNNDIVNALLLGKEAVCGSSLMIRKTVKINIGGYRDYFIGKVGEDIDWITRISHKYKISNIDYCGYYYRMSEGSLTRKVSYEAEKIYIHDFIVFLYKSRRDSNNFIDIVDCNNEKEISLFFDKYKVEHKDKPYKLYAKTSFGHALNKNYKCSLIDFSKCFHKKTSISVIVKTLVLLCIVIIMPMGFLLKIKEKLKINNIARRFIK